MNSKDKEQVIEDLTAKNKEYEKILTKLLAQPKMLGVITAGPVKDQSGSHYRCKVGGNDAIVTYDKEIIFKTGIQILEVGMEILVQNGHIIGVTPTELKKEEKTPLFKLVDWDEIGGLKSQMELIRDTIESPIKYAKLAKELGLAAPKGMLLHGPPGCGKTLVAKAIASTILGAKEVDARAFVYIKGAELLSMYVGATEQRIVNMFEQCRNYKKETGKQAVLFIDEAEAILPKRGTGRSSDVEKTIVPTFLAEMDGFEGNNPFVLLSTNLPSNIDDAILREGRIDLKVEVKRPTAEDCIDIFAIHFKAVKCSEEVSCLAANGAEELAKLPAFERISGSMIETVVKLSTQQTLKRLIKDSKSERGVIIQDVKAALKLVN